MWRHGTFLAGGATSDSLYWLFLPLISMPISPSLTFRNYRRAIFSLSLSISSLCGSDGIGCAVLKNGHVNGMKG
jgi:hypothetical protein